MLRFIRRRSDTILSQLPLVTPPALLQLDKARRVLVFAPHPDDETLGCGGTLSLLSATCAVRVVLVTDGAGAGALAPGAKDIRLEEFKQALKILGVHDFIELRQPDGAFSASEKLRSQVAALIEDFSPNWVFMPPPLDYHRDHVRISSLLEPICRMHTCIEYLLFYETWAPVPATHLVDITSQVHLKQHALAQHATALAHCDYDKAIAGLNSYRGIHLGKGKSAEAFWVEANAVKSDRRLFRQLQDIYHKFLWRLAHVVQ